MASVSSTHLVLFIAAILVAASVAGTVTEGATRLGGALGDQSQQHAEDIDAEIKIVSDAGSPQSIYDHSSETLTLYVKNVGGSTLSTDPDTISVLVNGNYQTDIETTVLDADSWGTGNLLRIRTDISLQPRADTRIVVTPTGARDVFLFRTPAESSSRSELVFATQNNALRSVDANESITYYDATATAIGPKEVDFDGDGLLEVPYVNDTNTLLLVDSQNEKQVLADNARKQGPTIGVGTWNGDTSVFYSSTDNKYIYRVQPGTTASRLSADIKSNAVGGPADFNGDGDTDLVFLGGSATVKYYDNGEVLNTGYSANSGTHGYGFGAPRQFDGTTPARAPITDRSSYPALVDYDNTVDQLSSQTKAVNEPVAGINLTGDERLEHVFVDGNGDIHYVTLDGNVETVVADVNASTETGVA
ncbi:hypothetical protein [Halobacterium sp. KA-6]|uniref:hypothetical protein n=1 Tax=Halobacterium sp. KA-6 TaxID=2896368 RepID=UPI001E5F6B76|nr:hypothetical protein [Halobacterium sp. KA-6]MCD2204318.1 hypothetical protein [Halobacterium sp. KA-6]